MTDPANGDGRGSEAPLSPVRVQPRTSHTLTTYEAADGSWTVAENNVWVPGVYATESAARLAVEFTDKMLVTRLGHIWDAYQLNRPATYEEVAELRNIPRDPEDPVVKGEEFDWLALFPPPKEEKDRVTWAIILSNQTGVTLPHLFWEEETGWPKRPKTEWPIVWVGPKDIDPPMESLRAGDSWQGSAEVTHRCTYSHADPKRLCETCGEGPYVQDPDHLASFARDWDERVTGRVT